MLLKLKSIKNRHLKRFLEHIFYVFIMMGLITGFYYFELCIVLPAVVEEWTIDYFIHIFCAMYLLINIMGNMIYGMFTNTTIRGRFLEAVDKENWSFCTVCECLRPPRAWHCEVCDVCVLKRDHHCVFFACCVGYVNHRYFVLFTFYVFIAMVYIFYFNVKFLAQFITWNHGFVIIQFVFPLVNLMLDFNIESLYVFLVVLNVIVGCFTGFLFYFHFDNILKGKTTHEKKLSTKEHKYDMGWKYNIIEVFGTRWYLTWISPFIISDLSGNGIDWVDNGKHN